MYPQHQTGASTSITGNTVRASILVEGRPTLMYRASGYPENTVFIEGVAGKHYAIMVNSIAGGRLECVESVDGRNVLIDEEASLNNRGLVFTGEWRNEGFRIDDTQVNDFIFADPTASIAARATGSTSNVGVIGIAVFKEYKVRPSSYGTLRGGGNYRGGETLRGGFGNEESYTLGGDLGTTMGQAREDIVGHTSFTRASAQPDDLLIIHYRSRAWLEQFGIIRPSDPEPFPGSRNNPTGYGNYI